MKDFNAEDKRSRDRIEALEAQEKIARKQRDKAWSNYNRDVNIAGSIVIALCVFIIAITVLEGVASQSKQVAKAIRGLTSYLNGVSFDTQLLAISTCVLALFTIQLVRETRRTRSSEEAANEQMDENLKRIATALEKLGRSNE